MSASASEVRPLVPSNNHNYGVYADDYTPVDEESRWILRRRRLLKYGGIVGIIVLATIAVIGPLSSHGQKAIADSTPPALFVPDNNAAVQADHVFAGILADEEAFYFPTTLKEQETNGRLMLRRVLKNPSKSVDWSYDWTQYAKDGAAIGEYYRAKGMAMSDYYRSKFDPTYKAAVATSTTSNDAPEQDAQPAAPPEDASTWTYDWKADMDRGIALGKHYKAIGDAINAHYRETFDPTYPAADGGSRRLKSKDKKLKDRKKKELAVDMAARDGGDVTSPGWYDWQTDRDRGMAIGTHYKQMGEEIADHYNQEFNPMYDVNKKVYTDKDWATAWQDYQKRGQEIANYYISKGAAIDKFYQGKYTLEGMASPIVDATVDSNTDTKDGTNANKDTSGDNPDAADIWGLDWKNDREHAMAMHDDMMKKGLAIGEYYRSKYDPTYGITGTVPASTQSSTSVGQDKEDTTDTANVSVATAAVTPVMHNPDLDYPPWGVDPAADRDHGIAIGQYWKQNGKAIGTTYQKRGMELGMYYENKYRSIFDPTFPNSG